MRIIGFVQARLGSTRLPQKVMLDILGKPMLWHVWKRVSAAKLLDETVIVTSAAPGNDAITQFAEKEKIPYFAGSETDLIGRYLGAAEKFRADAIVRVTADCPLADPALIDDLIREYQNSCKTLDYLSNSRPKATYPHGFDAELFTLEALQRIDREVADPFRREWLTTNFFEHPEKFRQKNLSSPRDLSHLRLTVDYQNDFDLVSLVFKELYKENETFKLSQILELLERRSDLMKACAQSERHESYSEEIQKRGGGA